MKFEDFVCFESVIAELQSGDRNRVIGELVSALNVAGRLGKGSCQGLIKAVIKREDEASTGMGKGIAVPHVKHSSVKEVVATVGKSKAGIDFAALDKQPVYTVILLVSPADNADLHLQA
ncbi:MAG: PTS sugar transporter subunit IIA, partial [Planctomycetota bacterium]